MGCFDNLTVSGITDINKLYKYEKYHIAPFFGNSDFSLGAW